MLDMAKGKIMKLDRLKAKEKLFNKDYVEMKKDTFEKFKNMGKNYKKDTLAIRNTNIKLQRKVRNMKIDFYFDLEGSEKN